MSAELLHEAASLMRERAERATSGPWEFHPRRGFQMVSDNPATIGFKDDAGYFVMLREGTWATEGDMSYVASWHPAVALAVADWLEHAASIHEDDADGEVPERCDCPYCKGMPHALTVARAYLGSES